MCRSEEYDPDRPLERRLSEYLSGRIESRKSEINWFLLRENIDWDEVTAQSRRLAEVLLSGVEHLGWFDDSDELAHLIQDQAEGGSEAGDIIRICEVEAVHQLLGDKAVAALGKAEVRFWELLRHVTLNRNTSTRGRAFLRRVSLCYLFGFDAECIVMCRAVLDAEFQAQISTDDCVQELGWTSNRRTDRDGRPLYGLAERIDVAERTGRIDSATRRRAGSVASHGNRVIHRDASTPPDALGVITDALAVIDALSS
jgi:hypothetical protein